MHACAGCRGTMAVSPAFPGGSRMRPDLSECAGRACPQRGDVCRWAGAVEQARESAGSELGAERCFADLGGVGRLEVAAGRSEEHTSELQSLMRTSYAVFCLTKKKNK